MPDGAFGNEAAASETGRENVGPCSLTVSLLPCPVSLINTAASVVSPNPGARSLKDYECSCVNSQLAFFTTRTLFR